MSAVPTSTNPDLASERRRAGFDVRALGEFLHGGADKLDERLRIGRFVDQTPELHDPKPVVFMTRVERVENAARKVVQMTKHIESIDVSDFSMVQYFQSLVMAGDYPPFILHYVMFLPTLQGQMTDEQQDKWLPLAMSRAILGTYAQTELGHGTNLKNLETTATYDAAREEFVVDSPTVSATKWWPGNLGKCATHAVVFAQLYTRGVCHGAHPFIVQLRHLDSHQPLPGVKMGDIGPKFGGNSNDNGYLMFDKFRIPRENMLMRFSKVLPDGTYVRPSHAKLAYGGMLFVRSVMIRDQALALATAATIATRYSSVRRQGEITPGAGEVPVLDYQTQQYRIVPETARAFAFYFASRAIDASYQTVSTQVKDGNVALLPELHAMAAGLKAVVTWEVAKGIEQCRLACGGHGYNHASGLPELYANTVGGCTYEGDNIVLLLQVARSLNKAIRSLHSGRPELAAIAAYLGVTDAPTKSRLNNRLDLPHFVEALEHSARVRCLHAVASVEAFQGRGFTLENAWNANSVLLCAAARAHIRVFIARNFVETLPSIADDASRRVMTEVCRLYLVLNITARTGDFLEDGYMTAAQVTLVNEAVGKTLAVLRPNLVALVDAWHFHDRELRSVLGREDGQVYANMLEWVKNSTLNQTEVLDSYHKYIGPMMKQARSKL